MRFRGLSRTFAFGVWVGIFLLGTITATAKDGRDFAGNYKLTNVQDHVNTVTLTLQVRLYNNSDAAISGAVVTLMAGAPEVGLRGSFPTVKTWKRAQGVLLNAQFTIPKREYLDWAHPPAQPNVVVMFQDANGQTWQRGAQLSARPAL